MPYIQRDASGHITAIFRNPPDGPSELVPAAHPDVLHFLEASGEQLSDEDRRHLLASLDNAMIRVVEDLVDVLIRKQVIMLTDLPIHAQRKVMARRETRDRLLGQSGFMPHEADDIL